MKDLYVVICEYFCGDIWTCTTEDGKDVMSFEEAQELLTTCNENIEVACGVWKYKIAKLSFLD